MKTLLIAVTTVLTLAIAANAEITPTTEVQGPPTECGSELVLSPDSESQGPEVSGDFGQPE
jgi:hypothetical protein